MSLHEEGWDMKVIAGFDRRTPECRGNKIKKGDEMGYFKFGGSTVVCVWQVMISEFQLAGWTPNFATWAIHGCISVERGTRLAAALLRYFLFENMGHLDHLGASNWPCVRG
jgi:hypothetical protein